MASKAEHDLLATRLILEKLDFIEIVKEKEKNLYKLKGKAEPKQTALFA